MINGSNLYYSNGTTTPPISLEDVPKPLKTVKDKTVVVTERAVFEWVTSLRVAGVISKSQSDLLLQGFNTRFFLE